MPLIVTLAVISAAVGGWLIGYWEGRREADDGQNKRYH